MSTYPLPFDTPLGRLVLQEVYDYFDGPRLFAARNDRGGLFLGYWADETESVESWLYLPITQPRLLQVRSGGVGLAAAFRAAEFGYAIRVDIDRITVTTRAAPIPVEDIPVDLLPPPTDRLRIPTQTQRSLPASELNQRAASERRDLVGFALRPGGYTRSEAPVELVTQTLSSLQGLTEEVGFRLALSTPAPSQKERVKIEHSTKLVAVGSYGGSFGLILGAEETIDLFNYSLLGDCLRAITTLLQAKDDERLLQLRLRHLRPRVSLRYRDLFQSLARQHSGLAFEWSSPRLGRRSQIAISSAEVRRISDIVSRTTSETGPEFTRRTRLIAANTRTGGYELRGVPGWEKYVGHALRPGGLNDLRHAAFDVGYDATLREEIATNALTGEIATKFLLVGLVKSADQTDEQPRGRRQHPKLPTPGAEGA